MKFLPNIQKNRFAAKILQFLIIAVLLSAGGNFSFAKKNDATEGGTIIYNRAAADYQDDEGNPYSVVSPTVSVTVLAVPAVTVTPDETAPSATIVAGEEIIRFFRICNTGNAADSFLALRGSATAPATIKNVFLDTDASGTVTAADIAVEFGQTSTPPLAPGKCFGVLYVVETNQVTAQSQISLSLSARSNLALPGGGFAEDSGTIVNVVGKSVRFTAPDNPSLPPVKLVENLPRYIAAQGQTLNYTIAFRNAGEVSARQVKITDELPAELEYVSGTMQLNKHSLTDADDADEGTAGPRRLQISIGEIAPNAVTEIKFQAKLIGNNQTGGGVLNTAQIEAANAPLTKTSEAVVVVNPIGTVYAGNSGGAARISGAQITIATDDNGTPLALVPDTGYAPNIENVNPFSSDANGNFSFALGENQIGAADAPVRYIFLVTAENYRSRMIQVLVTKAAGGFYAAQISALDGQPVAIANGFSLTNETVNLSNLAAMVFNIPMFDNSTLQITKSADKQSAEIGDLVTYTIQVRNATASTMKELSVRDVLPDGFVYAAGTAILQNGADKRSLEPAVGGGELVFQIGDLAAGANATISYRVRIGASAREGEQINTAVVSGKEPNGDIFTTQPAQAAVRVRAGIFSQRQIIIGRVYEDRNLNGRFDKGERPVSGARVYLSNGQSVMTDAAGLYNLPAVSEGTLVVSLDPVSLPDSYYLTDDHAQRSSKSWTRLLRTPLGGGMLLRQNFAIAPKKGAPAVDSEAKIIDMNAVKKPQTAKNETAPSTADAVQLAALKNKLPLNLPGGSKGPEKSANKSSETFTLETTEDIAPVAPGDVLLLSPQIDEVIMSPALSVDARVAKDWTIEMSVNGEKIGNSNLGETRVDNRNSITTFSFVGINLQPGENQVSLTAVGADGTRGKTDQFKIYGRGGVEKLEIVPAKKQIQAGGREALAIEIRTFDRWGNPALDGQVGIQTTAGRFYVEPAAIEDQAVTPELPRQLAVSTENGTAIVRLIGDGSADIARLKAVAGRQEATTDVRFTAELRPQIMVGVGEFAAGRAAPQISANGDDKRTASRLAFYYRGKLFNTDNLLTFAYDSNRALNRVAGHDRFGDFDPLDRAYPVFGDASQRFEDAQSNSKIYARLDHNYSYAMFGDMETDQQDLSLAGYSRRLTGVKLHLEDEHGNYVSVTGAKPDTAFARDVIPGGSLSLARLSHTDILPGSEVVTLEIRDRRNPELILSREQLVRSVDYNFNALTGEIFFLRPISTFDYLLNLTQIVVTYEYHGVAASNYVYTGRAVRNFAPFGLKIGASYVNQRQGELGMFQLGGLDIVKKLPKGGKLSFETAVSNGLYASDVNVFNFDDNSVESTSESANRRNGTAFRLQLDQPLPFLQSRLRGDFQRASQNFYNPFGTTVTAGSQRLQVGLEMRPTTKNTLAFGYTNEQNETASVSNSRTTLSALWSANWSDKFKTSLGYDHRFYDDKTGDQTIGSNLLTVGAEYRPLKKLSLSVKREENLTEADPTYPNQTTFAANYELNRNAKLFLTQRLASAPIAPIGDFSGGGGFASVGSQSETAFGIESKMPWIGALNGRYQVENGVNGTDNFAVIGVQNRWDVLKKFGVEAGFERGFLVKGEGRSFNSATLGGSWTPAEGFRATVRYELRDRNGLGQIFSLGAAGKIGENWTTLARAQWSTTSYLGRGGADSNITGAFAYRPVDSDRLAWLFSYNHRDTSQQASVFQDIKQAATRDRYDTLSSDGLYQVSNNTEIYARFALRFNGNGGNTTVYTSALTTLGQFRIQHKIGSAFDVAGEGRILMQPSSSTYRQSLGAEAGYWLMPDLRFGLGYNFTRAGESNQIAVPEQKQFKGGAYFTITSKISNLFNLFGTSKSGLNSNNPAAVKKPVNKNAEEAAIEK